MKRIRIVLFFQNSSVYMHAGHFKPREALHDEMDASLRRNFRMEDKCSVTVCKKQKEKREKREKRKKISLKINFCNPLREMLSLDINKWFIIHFVEVVVM